MDPVTTKSQTNEYDLRISLVKTAMEVIRIAYDYGEEDGDAPLLVAARQFLGEQFSEAILAKQRETAETVDAIKIGVEPIIGLGR